MRRFVLLTATCASFSCAAPQRANLAYLQYRAVFDLACPAQSLALYHIDERTKAVHGCGKQLVYIERCDQGAGNTCSWELDSPSFGQWAQTAASPPSPTIAPAAAPKQRTIPTELFGSSRATVPQRDANSRGAPTELFPPQPAGTTPPPSDGQPF